MAKNKRKKIISRIIAGTMIFTLLLVALLLVIIFTTTSASKTNGGEGHKQPVFENVMGKQPMYKGVNNKTLYNSDEIDL